MSVSNLNLYLLREIYLKIPPETHDEAMLVNKYPRQQNEAPVLAMGTQLAPKIKYKFIYLFSFIITFGK